MHINVNCKRQTTFTQVTDKAQGPLEYLELNCFSATMTWQIHKKNDKTLRPKLRIITVYIQHKIFSYELTLMLMKLQ